MAELMWLALEAIEVPERLRSVSADHAGMLAADIRLRGLLQPVVVRGPLPGGRWVLLAGAHRLEAMRLLGRAEIPAVAADVANGGWAAELVEIAENLFRNDLSALERAVYVVRYRAAWEVKHGRKGRGGDRRSAAFRGDADQTDNMSALKSEEQEFLDRAGLSGFADHVAERLGFTERTIYRDQGLIRGLHPELVKRLMGTAVADNRALLLRVSRLAQEVQAEAVAAIDAGTPVEDAVAALFPLPEVDENKPYERATKAFGRLNARQRRAVVLDFYDEIAAIVDEVRRDA